MSIKIFKQPIEVVNRLNDLGTSRETLLEVVAAMVSAKADCTDNDPSGSPGWRSWQMGSRRLRETHVGNGDWEKDNTDQVPSILSPKLGIRIVVCNTDDGTAIEKGHQPQNRSKKGSATDRAVSANQGSFMDKLDESINVIDILKRKIISPNIVTYFLCCFSEGDDIRAELSCPVNVENGFFGYFVERILITGGDTVENDSIRRKSDNDSDGDGAVYDITVTRKK